MPIRAKIFVAIITAAGAGLLGIASCIGTPGSAAIRLLLSIAILASTLKIRLPGMESTMSVHFLVVLLGTLEFRWERRWS